MSTREDAARMAHDDAAIEAWMAEHAEQIEEEAYQDWAAIREEDGEDSSREAYDSYIQSLIPDE